MLELSKTADQEKNLASKKAGMVLKCYEKVENHQDSKRADK